MDSMDQPPQTSFTGVPLALLQRVPSAYMRRTLGSIKCVSPRDQLLWNGLRVHLVCGCSSMQGVNAEKDSSPAQQHVPSAYMRRTLGTIKCAARHHLTRCQTMNTACIAGSTRTAWLALRTSRCQCSVTGLRVVAKAVVPARVYAQQAEWCLCPIAGVQGFLDTKLSSMRACRRWLLTSRQWLLTGGPPAT